MSALDRILASYRDAAVTKREQGTYFERLCVTFLQNDPIQHQQYSEVMTFAEWAIANGENAKDTGIDLVAKLRDEEGYAAIQCKFYAADYQVQKKDIDSFLSASSRSPFVSRIVIDTTEVDWTNNADATIAKQSIPVVRLGLNSLRESAIDWAIYELSEQVQLHPKKSLRPHQQQALEAVTVGFAEHDRGKLIMACGTGKTFTALKIAEKLAGKGKQVLVLVPSLALIAQTVREWTKDTTTELRSFAVCSDAQVGKRRVSNTDIAEIEAHELDFPATTNPARLTERASVLDSERMTVVFSTYQSIPVITAAQQEGLSAFDLIICDEAHRTTGAKIEGEEDSNFVRVHDNKYVNGAKRLYMTATPRIFGEGARAKAADASVQLCDMDDEAIYGPTFFTRGFSWAVENGLLTDYKVIVLAMDETVVSRSVQKRLAADNELKLDDATKIIGCYKALLKQGSSDEFSVDANSMQRAIAFCKDIRSSQLIAREFDAVVNEFTNTTYTDDAQHLTCSIQHVDGTFNAKTRGELLHWLGDDIEAGECRILTNARCLSEGVDVPSLDAILFMHPRKSQIDVVQSVGRVMRRAEGKKFGYVILPVVIPADVAPEDALNDNERYRVVWQILNALRAHDDRFDATINRLDLTNDTSGQIEVVAVSENMPNRQTSKETAGIGEGYASDGEERESKRTEEQLNFIFDEFPAAIRAKIVQKCGRRTYWEDWAKDIGKIAQQHIERIKATLHTDAAARTLFDEFLAEIRDDLNSAVTDEEAVEMLAQHLITKPVFDALFEDYNFAAQNPVSQAMQKVVTALEEKNINKEAETLEGFYASVRKRASGIDSAEGKQKIVVELYEKFFKTAFPKLSDKLGIVYTPVEVVDFILHSVNDILEQEFGQTLGCKNVHILDPFTGTGTFITRLLQSGLISSEQLEYKYKNEIHANEIVLLAYYIAAINIEATYHAVSGKDYTAFNGICLTDTFEMYETEDLVARLMEDNSERRSRQKALDIRVIVGNPPYNVSDIGVEYKNLNSRIAKTYAAQTESVNKNSLYNSYIKAIRWASDRLADSFGIIGFISGNGWVERTFANGLRKCLMDEFSSIYVINLRGDIRKNILSKGRAGEGENIFAQGSMSGICITFLVKGMSAERGGNVYYYDIGDNMKAKQKLSKLSSMQSVKNLTANGDWKLIQVDQYGDWINKRDKSFEQHILIGDKKSKSEMQLFVNYTSGVKTQRDAWCYNASEKKLRQNIRNTIVYYTQQMVAFREANTNAEVEDFCKDNDRKISWTTALKNDLQRKRTLEFEEGELRLSAYRPFNNEWLYYGRRLNERLYQTKHIFPTARIENKVIAVTGVGARSGFSVQICGDLFDIQFVDNGQAFPLYIYEALDEEQAGELFENEIVKDGYRVKDGITDYGLEHFQAAYTNKEITKEDIFYYVYGLLHSEDYRTRFADNLSKELPRIPAVKKEDDFWAFVSAGRALGELHVNYESADMYPVTFAEGSLELAVIDDEVSFFRVEKMRFGGKRGKADKTIVHYNKNLTICNIPLAAYDYVVNGRSALEWVMERQGVKVDKKSGIVNDANDYAVETLNNPAYPLQLFQRVITVSLETMKIVRSLPALDID